MVELNTTIGPIMKAARKFKKFNQSEVAKAIGCSQSALSKMEHNLLVPSAPQWFLFSRFTSIPPETLESGYIDRRNPVKFNSDEVSLGFKIPRRYRTQRAEKVRELYPFLKYLQKHHLEEVQKFITTSEIDPEFFVDFDNLINFSLYANIIDSFIRLRKDDYESVCAMASEGQDDIFWDSYGDDWKNLKTVEELLAHFTRKQIYFQTDFQVTLENKNGMIFISYRPEVHLKSFDDKDGRITQFLNYYRKCSLENLVKRFLGKEVEFTVSPDAKALGGRFVLKD